MDSGFAGPTAVIDQLFDAEQGKAVPDSPERTALVFPFKNQYMLFDGRLGHGVLGSSSKQPRMTMLVNWWAKKPQVLCKLTTTLFSTSQATLCCGPCVLPSCALYLHDRSLSLLELRCTYRTA